MLADFFKKYRTIFLYLPILYVAGNIHPLLAVPVFLVPLAILMGKGQREVLLMFFMVVVILGDSRRADFFFFKNLRLFAMLAMVLLSFADLGKKKYSIRPLFALVVSFFLIAVFVLGRSPMPATSFQKALSYFLLFFLVLHQWNHLSKNHGKDFFRDVIVLATVCYLLGFFSLAIGAPSARFNGRFRGIFGNPNGLGIHTTLMFSVIFFYFRSYPEVFSRSWKLLIWVALFSSILMCGSRNTLASIGIFLLFFFFFKGGFFRKILFFLIVIPLAISFVNLEFIVSLVTRMGLGETLRIESILSGTGRFHAWDYAMDIFKEYKWFGRGFHFDQTILDPDTMPLWLIKTGHNGDVHNSYISFLLNTGIIGLVNLILIIIGLIRRVPYGGAGIAIGMSATFSSFFEPWFSASLNAFTSLYFLTILFATHHAIVLAKKT